MSSPLWSFLGATIALGGPSGGYPDQEVSTKTASIGYTREVRDSTSSQALPTTAVGASPEAVEASSISSRTATVVESPPEPVVASLIEFHVRTKKSGGKVRCGLYDQKKDWLTSRYVFKSTATIEGRRAVCTFHGVPPGVYAISAYHDKNDNGKLDKNFLGLPKEDFTFSSGAKARFGPPSFKDALFNYTGGLLRTSGKM